MMTLRLRTTLTTLALALGMLAGLGVMRSEALPIFGRDRKLPCSTCHMAFPRLNQMGMHYKQNGYRMPGEKGTSPWEQDHYPIAVIGNIGAHWSRVDAPSEGDPTTRVTATMSNFQQNLVEFHMAGTLAPTISYHFDSGFNEANMLEGGQAWAQFDDVAQDGRLNVKVGIFDGEIPYMSNARRTTQGDYLTNWTQDNAGVELNGTANSWTYAAGVVNSERTHGKAGSTNLNQLENVYAWLMRDVSNSMVTARVRYEREDPRVADKDASTHLQTDVSAFISPSSGRWAVIPGVTMEHSSDMVQKERYTPMLEAIALLDKDGQWVGTGRYETARIPAAGGYDALTAMRLAFDLSYYVNPNARIGLDWTHDTVDQGGPKMDEVQAFVHVGY